jgi:hypothetical protein
MPAASAGVDGRDHLQAGHVGVEGLDRLGVIQRAVDAAAPRRTDHERAAEVPVRPVAHPRRLRHDLVERRMDEVGELDLGHRQEPVQRHPDRDADEARLRQRRVDHTILAELLHPAGGDPEHPAASSDVLAEQDDALVVGHLVVQGIADRRHDVLLCHASSAKT